MRSDLLLKVNVYNLVRRVRLREKGIGWSLARHTEYCDHIISGTLRNDKWKDELVERGWTLKSE